MSKISFVFIIITIMFSSINTLFGIPADREMCTKIAEAKIIYHGINDIYTIKNISSKYNDKGEIQFYIFELAPQGFIITTADTDLPPIIGYSFRNTIDADDETSMPYQAIALDISYRYAALQKLPEDIKQHRNADWSQLIENKGAKDELYWPDQDSTNTGGWVQTQWNQAAPYYDYCPWDMVTDARSLAGCPAIATAQIINYFTNINGAKFNNGDDYYHSYAGRDFTIDDDYSTRDFASFPDLNEYLLTYDSHKKLHQSVTNSDKAALCFACGVAATQVYTSEVSGTFYLSQVVDALEKFGYFGTITIDDTDPNFWSKLSQNMKDGQPAQLTVLVTGGNGGHNVVVDGYNTLNEYHINFGWGGYCDGWYILPDEFPASLTTIHGVTMNIYSDPVPYYDPPANLVYTTNQDPSYVDLTWQLPSRPDVVFYNVYRNGVLINTDPVFDLVYHDDTAIYGKDYNYYITAMYDIGESNPSNNITVNWEVSIDEPQSPINTQFCCYPNPFKPLSHNELTFSFYGNSTHNQHNISIYNIKGELMRTLQSNHHETSKIVWNGKDTKGQIVPSGIYFISIDGENKKLEKILLLK